MTISRKTSSWSWWTQWPAFSMSTMRALLKGRRPAVLLGILRPALRSPDQERGTGDPRPELRGFLRVEVVGRESAHVVVELPAIGAVLVLVDPVHRQVCRLLGGQVRVDLLHALHGLFDRPVVARRPAGELAQCLDPLPHALARSAISALGELRGGGSEALDRHDLHHILGIDPRVLQGDRSAERVADDRDRGLLLLVYELRDVGDVVDHRVVATEHPLGITVATQVRSDDVVVAAQVLRYPVPVAAVVAAAVDEQQGRGSFVSPIGVMQAQPLREVRARCRPRDRCGHVRP